MRGKDLTFHQQIPFIGITPAYAGKRRAGRTFENCNRDHPRVCGEKHRRHRATNRPMGSPPRMRGKVGLIYDKAGSLGITPAYAGKSCFITGVFIPDRDHPRVCGEKGQTDLLDEQIEGSPPRMRGKVLSMKTSTPTGGITPAYAGKRMLCLHWRRRYKDHPRVCGEKPHPQSAGANAPGSPPRMRGKVLYTKSRKPLYRITPAYAGKSCFITGVFIPDRDHPRVCGEKGTGLTNVTSPMGSPPRMRGKAAAARAGLVAVGITPAYAGKRL